MTDAPPGAAEPVTARVSAGIMRGALLIASVTVASRIVGFARVVVFARTVGPTCLGDVYTTANTIPNIVFDVVAGGALSGLVVPVLAGRIGGDQDAEARQIVGSLLTWTLALLIPMSILGALLSHPLMSLLVGGGHPGCDPSAETSLGGQMLVVFAPQIALYGVGIVLSGTLQARRRFFWPALAPLLSSLVVIATYLIFAAVSPNSALSTHLQTGTAILAIGTTLGVAALSLPLIAPALRGFPIRPGWRFPPGVAVTVRRLAIAGAVVLASQDLATAVVLRLANADGTAGAVVAWNLGWTVFLLPWAVLAVPVATSAFPVLSAAWHDRDLGRFDRTVLSTTRVLVVVMWVATAVLVAVAGPGARVLIAGAPGHLSPVVLQRALVGFAVGLPAYGLAAHLSRVRFARTDARSPAVAVAVGWAMAIVIDLIATPQVPASWVPATLAGGASLGMWLSVGLLAIPVVRDLGPSANPLWRSVGAGLAAAAVGAAAGVVVCAAVPAAGAGPSVGVVVLGTAVTLAVAVATLALIDRDDLASILAWARRD